MSSVERAPEVGPPVGESALRLVVQAILAVPVAVGDVYVSAAL